ncbi:phage tail protein [Mesobacillus subterraneus]|uniref:phage tail spike protein n=1 Tax=Mesobacillus subterraneus TaxID=285983 RepID=UPI002042608C|nr:phage tail spike protein [Mesobacillus subterraneus]MCM3665504.1 phage tail protein [Mesobacillus subterraneus]MCM3686063.1 phage tail protein [Mesobacillus subterraneus]
MIKILNQNRQTVAILENAYDISYEKSFNALWVASFSLPLDDEKNDLCKPLYYVEVYDNGEYVGLFRIIPKETTIDEGGNTVKYQCEHVLATLLDSSIFKYRQIDGLPTNESIEYVLGFQKQAHWVLGNCEITRYFSYKFENSNVLSALFSIPQPFDQAYQWTYDTTVYPWRLNLLIPDDVPTCEIREGKNLRGLTLTEDPMGIYNRIYPLGYGEGDNQLTIESVNGGVPYIEDSYSVAEYGIREYIWSDKKFENAASLKASAEALLAKWREVIASWRISAAELSAITGEDIDKLRMGRIVRLVVPILKKTIDLRIVKESKSDVTGSPGDVQLEIGNKVEDLGTTQADLERRAQINELYSQGATNYQSYSYNDNADQSNPAEIVFYLSDDVVKVNELNLWFETSNFRAYEKAIGGGGASSVTSSAGGAVSSTSSSGGGTSSTSSEEGEHVHRMFLALQGPVEALPDALFAGKNSAGQTVNINLPANGVDLYTYSSSGKHYHTFQVPPHVHTFQIDNHVHTFTLLDHIHEILWGIFKLPELPTAVTIKVDGNTVPFTNVEGENIDLVPYLDKDTDGRITRGKHVVSIAPNERGRINAQINTKYFIQSRGSYTL